MANQVNPLTIFDTRNRPRVEPFVSGVMRTQTRERGRPILVNDLVMIGAFHDGKPGTLARFSRLDDLEANHDPTNTGDESVQLCRRARLGFADPDVFGAADIITYRVDPATPSFAYIKAGATDLIKVTRNSYGYHANGSVGGARHKVLAGTVHGKKVVLKTGAKDFTLDNIGRLFNLKYTGNGTGPTVTIRRASGKITYTNQPADQDKLTINGVVFEFESTGGVTGGNTPVAVGGDMDATFLALTNAINTVLGPAGVTATHDAANNAVNLSAPQQGVLLVETTDTGNVMTVSMSGQGVFLQTSITNPTDGSQAISASLTSGPYSTIDQLVNWINAQDQYEAVISPYAEGALLSVGLDPVTAVSIAAGGANLTGYVAAITNAINTRTQGNFTAEALVYGTEPDEVLATAADTVYTGGTSPVANITHYEAALAAIAAQLELGGVLLVDTTNPAVLTMVAEFCLEQQGLGKWFRFYGACAPNEAATLDDRLTGFLDLSGQVDLNLGHLVCQRMQEIGRGGEVRTLSPLHFAAALAGAAAGNVPFQTQLTNKRLRFVAIHPSDEFTVDQRARLIAGGITLAKKERDTIRVVLHLTTSHDPVRSMERIASERATVDLIDANVREAFLEYRGQWANANIAARVNGTLRQVLDRFVASGALVRGQDEDGSPVPPWETVPAGPNGEPWVLTAGNLNISYQIFIGSELRGINLRGNAEFARIVGTLQTSALTLTTVVPLT